MKRLMLVACLASCGRIGFEPGETPSDGRQGDGTTDACGPGMCAPFEVATFSSSPRGLAIDQDNVYWTTTNDEVMQCPRTGCGNTPIVLATGEIGASSIVVSDSTVFWADYNFQNLSVVNYCAKGGCNSNPTAIASNQTPFMVALGTNKLFWTNFNQQTVSFCMLGTTCGGTPPLLVSNATSAWDLALDARDVYFSSNTGTGTIQRCAIDGCADTPTLVVDQQVNPGALAIDGTDLYWLEFGLGRIHRCSIANCKTTDTLLTMGQSPEEPIIVDATNVYWTNNNEEIRSCAKTGCTTPTTIVSGYTGIEGFAFDGSSLYFAHAGGISMITR